MIVSPHLCVAASRRLALFDNADTDGRIDGDLYCMMPATSGRNEGTYVSHMQMIASFTTLVT